MAYRLAILSLLCAIIGLSSAQQRCDIRQLNNIVGCCPNLPRVLSPGSFEKCLPVFEETQRQYMAFEAQNNKVVPRGGGLCMMKCVLYVEGLLTPDNKTDIAKIKEGLLKNITKGPHEAEWKSVVEKSIENATATMEKHDFDAARAVPEGVRKCSPVYAMVMATIRRNLALGCPGFPTDDDVCSNNRKALLNCNPIRVANIAARKGNRGSKNIQGKGARNSKINPKSSSGKDKSAKKGGAKGAAAAKTDAGTSGK